MANVLAEMWQECGCVGTIIPQKLHGNHLKVEWGSGDEQLLVLCHMDTVWGKGETARRPFKIERAKAYGPGVYDMKAGIIQALFATKTLKTLGVEPKGRIVFLHNSDEEIGSPSSKCYIEEEAKKSKAVLVLEPSIPGGALKTWRKGVATFEIKINGRGGHAGADYYEGASAILEAAHQTVYLHSLSSFEDGTTVNVGVVNGGIASNVIADEVLLNVDVRVKTAEAGERITKKILELKPVDSNTSIKIEGGMNRPPMERNSRNLALFRIAEQVAAQMSINLTESGTGGASDGNFTSALGIPTLDGLGAVGGGGHSVDEHLEVTSLIERGAILAGLLFKLG